MPLYDYRCKNCGNEAEVLQSIGEPPLTDCDVCGAAGLEKVPSAPAFSFKGGGWYKDLYSSAGSGGKPADAGGDNASKKETKSESKPESKKAAASSSST